MKKTLTLFLFILFVIGNAQYEEEDTEPIEYQTAAGLYFDMSSDLTLYGVQVKQFLREDHAINAQLLLADKIILVGVDYTYNVPVPMPFFYRNLSWYAGAGAHVLFINGERDNEISTFAIRPVAGLEYKMKKYPLAFHAELKPWWSFGENGEFELSRIGVGIKYVINRDIW
ncbi:MAG: hypothetical protein WCY77_02170 [Weeksellaceae bacterium]